MNRFRYSFICQGTSTKRQRSRSRARNSATPREKVRGPNFIHCF